MENQIPVLIATLKLAYKNLDYRTEPEVVAKIEAVIKEVDEHWKPYDFAWADSN